ncbi:MAG: hypothetical protein M1812_002859 [Candelaria pacifica]|nr:MAG: hypothetical protein M1812_002859 [Candelaria pacifica]
MANNEYGLLDQAEEDALHKERLLNVEEKPFRRITKRLLATNSLISTPSALPPTPPPDASAADEAAAALETTREKRHEEHQQWHEDMLLDFAAYESSIARIQFTRTSNELERSRYAAEKLKIEATAQAVRENTVDLHAQLEQAQKTLALRKTYDELADKITSNRLLRTREDQNANLDRLNKEIDDLEKESRDYAQTWKERREQFGRIVEEGQQLRRLIRDEKEEVERREGMEEGEDVEERESSTQRGDSAAGTPRPDAGGATPSHTGQDGGGNTPGGLTVGKYGSRRASPLRSTSRGRSPFKVDGLKRGAEGETLDELMGKVTKMPRRNAISVDRPVKEEGEVSVEAKGAEEQAKQAGTDKGLEQPVADPAEGVIADPDGDEDEGEIGSSEDGGEKMDIR